MIGGVSPGDRYNMLTAISFVRKDSKYRSFWLWECDCGETVIRRADGVKCNDYKSCGCYYNETRGKTNYTHGMTHSTEFKIWQAMIQRCTNDKIPHYHNYGGRGIKVCGRWIDSFEWFYADMGPRPSDNHSIDRIDVDGDYEPGNCRWATSQEQNWNRRDNVYYELRGSRIVQEECLRLLGCSYSLFKAWIEKGLSPDEIDSMLSSTRRKGLHFHPAPEILILIATPDTRLDNLFDTADYIVVSSVNLSESTKQIKVLYGQLKTWRN